MKDKIIALYKKYEELVNYIIVGIMTTLVSWLVYFGSVYTFLEAEDWLQLQVANILSWVAGKRCSFLCPGCPPCSLIWR